MSIVRICIRKIRQFIEVLLNTYFYGITYPITNVLYPYYDNWELNDVNE